VDSFVYGPDGCWAVEVKNAQNVRRDDVRSLKAFREDYPECEPILVHRGDDRLVMDGVHCLPAHELLVGLRPGVGPGE